MATSPEFADVATPVGESFNPLQAFSNDAQPASEFDGLRLLSVVHRTHCLLRVKGLLAVLFATWGASSHDRWGTRGATACGSPGCHRRRLGEWRICDVGGQQSCTKDSVATTGGCLGIESSGIGESFGAVGGFS